MQRIVNSRPYSKSCPERHWNWKSNFAVENTQVIGNVGRISAHVEKELTDHVLRSAFCGDWTELTQDWVKRGTFKDTIMSLQIP
jgi:hypothetical protein